MSRQILSMLIVDDDEADIELLRRQIEVVPDWRAELEAARTAEHALALLQRREFDIVFLDYMLGGASSLLILKPILDSGNARAVIMVTGRGNEEVAVQAIKAGAEDYLVKSHLLPQRLRHAVFNALQRADLRRTVQMQQEALLDAERQRVMIESLGAVCHHLGQPLSTMAVNLQTLKGAEKLNGTREQSLLDMCAKATERLADVIHHIREVREYRTKPYLPSTNILDIGMSATPDAPSEVSRRSPS
jgi:ActR/RegA family two-component response regulator